MPDPEDWQYCKVSPFFGHQMKHFDEDLYELHIVRQPGLEDFQPIFSNFLEIDEYPTKDLLAKHPTKPDL